jgi:hypothetical protein
MRPDDTLKQLRPAVVKEDTEANQIERFQNEVLRPILKFQNEIFLIEWSKSGHFELIQSIENPSMKRKTLTTFLAKNPKLSNRYLGMVCGLFTAEEFTFYLSQKSIVDKRIKELLITRFLSYQA